MQYVTLEIINMEENEMGSDFNRLPYPSSISWDIKQYFTIPFKLLCDSFDKLRLFIHMHLTRMAFIHAFNFLNQNICHHLHVTIWILLINSLLPLR